MPENQQNSPSDEIQITTPYGVVRSRTKDVMQFLPFLAFVGLVGVILWFGAPILQQHIQMQQQIAESLRTSSTSEHQAIIEALRELTEEQALTNYINSLPIEQRPHLMVPSALRRRIAKDSWTPPDR